MCFVAWLGLLVPFAASLPTPSSPASGTRFPWHNTEMSNLEVSCVRDTGRGLYACNMKAVDFYDPNSELVQEINGAHCEVPWSWDGHTTQRGPNNSYASGFTVCSVAAGSLFQVQISRFYSASEWIALVSHKYRDDIHFEPPHSTPNSFTQFEFPRLHPNESEKGDLGWFRYAVKDKIEAPVVGLSLG